MPKNGFRFVVLGRFLHSLNQFALEEYGLDFDLTDYHEYNFAKVSFQRAERFSCGRARPLESSPRNWSDLEAFAAYPAYTF